MLVAIDVPDYILEKFDKVYTVRLLKTYTAECTIPATSLHKAEDYAKEFERGEISGEKTGIFKWNKFPSYELVVFYERDIKPHEIEKLLKDKKNK